MKVQSALLLCATGALAVNALPIYPTLARHNPSEQLLLSRVSTEPSPLPMSSTPLVRKRSANTERGIPLSRLRKRQGTKEDRPLERFAPMAYPVAAIVRRQSDEGGAHPVPKDAEGGAAEGGAHPHPKVSDKEADGADPTAAAEGGKDDGPDAKAEAGGTGGHPDVKQETGEKAEKPEAKGEAGSKADNADAKADGNEKPKDDEAKKGGDKGAKNNAKDDGKKDDNKKDDGKKDGDKKEDEKEGKDDEEVKATLPKGVEASSSGFLFLPVKGSQAGQEGAASASSSNGALGSATGPSTVAAPQRNTYFINIESPLNNALPPIQKTIPPTKPGKAAGEKSKQDKPTTPETPPEAAKGQTRIVFKPLTDPEQSQSPAAASKATPAGSAPAPSTSSSANGNGLDPIKGQGDHDYFLFPVSQPNEKVNLNKGDLIAYVDNPQRAAAAANGGSSSGGGQDVRPNEEKSIPPTSTSPSTSPSTQQERASLASDQEPSVIRRRSHWSSRAEASEESRTVGQYFKRSFFSGSPRALPRYWEGQTY